jgi:hypothetical protein
VPSGKWCKSTAFRHSCARSSKRAGGFIPRIALDQCRDPERYRTRVPFRTPEREVDRAPRCWQRTKHCLQVPMLWDSDVVESCFSSKARG